MFVNEVKRSMMTDSNSVPEFHYGEVATDFRMPLPDQFEWSNESIIYYSGRRAIGWRRAPQLALTAQTPH